MYRNLFVKICYFLIVALCRSGAELEEQVSHTLDYLLDKDRYNKQMRPPGHPDLLSPVLVQINMAIRQPSSHNQTSRAVNVAATSSGDWS